MSQPKPSRPVKPVTELERVLMERDGDSLKQVRADIREARKRVDAGEDPDEVLYEEFGLEPDYIFDLLA